MQLVRERAEARWLPSRHRYALARLVAFVRLSTSPPQPRPGLILAVDRDQSSLENHFLTIWFMLSLTAYVAWPMCGAWKFFALPLALVIVQLPMYLLGGAILPLLGRPMYAYNHRLNSVFMWALMTVASSYFAAMPSGWTRFVAYFYFAVLALNALAAVVLFALRGKVAEAEARCGA